MARRNKNKFYHGSGTEQEYARDLRKIAREIGNIVNRFNVTDPANFPQLRQALQKYAEIIAPWARQRARSIIEIVNRKNRKLWMKNSEHLAAGIRQELNNTDIGTAYRALMNEQVKLITSLPTDAAKRVHELVIKNVEQQGRASEIAKEIQRSGEVTESRATLIARTEVSRAASVLTQVRAQSIGSEGYIWRTAHDSDVRPSHKKMEGKFVRWDDPPTLDNLTGHAGALPNCRCYAEPVIPEI